MRVRMRLAIGAVTAVTSMAVMVPAVQAQATWNELTTLHFDNPVLIPGRTLQPGTYVFKLADEKGDRNIMKVYTQDQQNLLATVITVPTKRTQPNGDIVLKFAHTEGSQPAALKAFYYPGSLYGHEFVYPDQEAQQIAEQSHKVVLSHDVDDTGREGGTIHLTDQNGTSTAWKQNPDVTADWNAWLLTWQPQATRQTSTTATPSAENTQVYKAADRGRTPADDSVTGTSGRTGTTTATDQETARDHAEAIQRLVNEALSNGGSTVTIDRATLRQIRSHAEAIARAENSGGPR